VKSPQVNFNAKAHFSSRLRQAVEKDGRTKTAIAASIGVQPSALSRWLADVIPDAANLTRLAAALDVSVQWLLTDAASGADRMREDVTPYHFTPRALTSSVLCAASADEWLRTCHLMLDHCACIDNPQALNYALLGIYDT